MGRSINPVPDYPRTPGGDMYYFRSGTNDPMPTFADSSKGIANAHPVPLDINGELPNVWFDGSAKQILKNAANETIWERDPVGGDASLGAFSLWSELTIYDEFDIVEGSDGLFYISKADSNQGNDPTTPSPSSWSQIRFMGIYNASHTYGIGDVVQDAAGDLWKSLTASNLGNTPSTNPSDWVPAISGSKVPEIITLETRTTTAIQQTGAATLSALRLNQLQDGTTFLLPLANSVSDGQLLVAALPSEFAAFTPTVNISGSDTITFSGGTDTAFEFDSGALTVRFMSDGISDWSLSL